MPWSTSSRRAELPPDWPALRQAVIERDRGMCRLCGDPGNEVDHIGDPHDHGLHNLRLLCGVGTRNNCHGKRTAQQAAAARPRRWRDPEPHPGLSR